MKRKASKCGGLEVIAQVAVTISKVREGGETYYAVGKVNDGKLAINNACWVKCLDNAVHFAGKMIAEEEARMLEAR